MIVSGCLHVWHGPLSTLLLDFRVLCSLESKICVGIGPITRQNFIDKLSDLS